MEVSELIKKGHRRLEEAQKGGVAANGPSSEPPLLYGVGAGLGRGAPAVGGPTVGTPAVAGRVGTGKGKVGATVGGATVGGAIVGGAMVGGAIVGTGSVGKAVGTNVGTIGGNVGKIVGRAVGITGGRAATVGRIGAAGAGGWGRKEYHQGSLPGAGQSEANRPKMSRATTTAPSWRPSRLSLVYVPRISCRRASAAMRCALIPCALSRLCDGAER